MELPDQMPDGCNFYGLLRTALPPAAIAERFAAASWRTSHGDGQQRLEISWGRLTLMSGDPMVLQGWLDRPDERVGAVLGLLGGVELDGVYQWINAGGRLWRELPFDESLLDVDDPRLPADIKESIRASRQKSVPTPLARKPWWQFW